MTCTGCHTTEIHGVAVVDAAHQCSKGQPVQIVWTTGSRTREIMTHEMETFRTYVSPQCPGYLIERWEGSLFGIFHNDTFCTSRQTLRDAKALVVDFTEGTTGR